MACAVHDESTPTPLRYGGYSASHVSPHLLGECSRKRMRPDCKFQ
jgi:hypothetical protein